MTRRIQGLCLLLLGAILGWMSGSEISRMAKGPIDAGQAAFVGVKLLLGLVAVFVGVVFVAGVPLWGGEDDEPPAPPA
jgi:hypothetical protein